MNVPIFNASLTTSQRPRDPEEECRLLRTALCGALRVQNMAAVAAFLERLELADPEEPRWPHQHGDTLVLLGDEDSARQALRRAADLYFERGLLRVQQTVLKQLDELHTTG